MIMPTTLVFRVKQSTLLRVCVCVCAFLCLVLNHVSDFWRRCLACWFISKVEGQGHRGQNSRPYDETLFVESFVITCSVRPRARAQ